MAKSTAVPHFGLRERKTAQTKVALVNAFLEQLRTKPAEDIAVRQVCDAIPVSEVTFYNYFPRKQDVVAFHMALWSIRMQWQCANSGLHGLEAVRQVYQAVAEGLTECPFLFPGAFQPSAIPDISPAEIWAALPSMEGAEQLGATTLASLIRDRLEESRELGELPSSIDIDAWLPTALTTLFGVPAAIAFAKGRTLADEYSRQLDVLLESMRRDERRR
jgi:AcrR family transcriptional regulator